MRFLVKRLLRKYGYPPDLQDAACKRRCHEAEALSADWRRDLNIFPLFLSRHAPNFASSD